LAKAGEGTLGGRAAVARVAEVINQLDDLLGDEDTGMKLARIAKTRILETVEKHKAG
jgi:hypothetical protein